MQRKQEKVYHCFRSDALSNQSGEEYGEGVGEMEAGEMTDGGEDEYEDGAPSAMVNGVQGHHAWVCVSDSVSEDTMRLGQ